MRRISKPLIKRDCLSAISLLSGLIVAGNRAMTEASILSVLANTPMACASRRLLIGLTITIGKDKSMLVTSGGFGYDTFNLMCFKYLNDFLDMLLIIGYRKWRSCG